MAEKSGALSLVPSEPPELTQRQPSIPGDQKPQLSKDELQLLAQEIEEIILAYESATGGRRKLWEEFEKIYSLTPRPTAGGEDVFSEHLVTEMGRSHVNTAHSRVAEQIIGMSNPWVHVEIAGGGDDLPGEEQKEADREAKDWTRFLHAYNRERGLEDRLDDALARAAKLGMGFIKQSWKVRKRERRILAGGGTRWKTVTEDLSGIVFEGIHPRDFIGWPLDCPNVKDLLVAGHRSSLTVPEFRVLCSSLGMSQARTDALIKAHQNKETRDPEEGPASGVKGVASPLAKLEVWELWVKMPLPAEETKDGLEPRGYQCFLLRDPREVLSVDWTPINCGRHPYFRVPYWELDGTWMADGVLSEIRFRQAADDALRNLEVAGIRNSALYLTIVNEESSLFTQHVSNIQPGQVVATENPKDDINVVSLGAEVETVQEAQQINSIKAMEADGITAPTQGFGDPTLKSGASPSSLQLLVNEAGKKLGRVDRNIRKALDELFEYQLELIQQFASRDLFYSVASEETAGRLVRASIARPEGDLRAKYRIRVSAPSQSNNSEVTHQKALIFYNFTREHVQTLLALAQQVWGQQDPGRIQRITEEAVSFLHALFMKLKDLTQLGPLQSRAPDVQERSEDELRAALQEYQQLAEQMKGFVEQLQQELSSAQQENQMMQQAMGAQQGEGFPPVA